MPDISLLQREYDVVQEESRMPSIVFTAALILFLVCVGAYVGLYAYNSFLTGEIESVNKRIDELKVGDAFKSIEQLTAVGARIKMLKSLRESHTSVRKTLAKVEGVTHPSVNFTTGSFEFAGDAIKVSLKGKALSPAVFLRQVELYQADKNVSDFTVGNPSYEEKHSVALDVSLTLRKQSGQEAVK